MYTNHKYSRTQITNILKLLGNDNVTQEGEKYHQALASKIHSLRKPLYQITLCEMSHIFHQLEIENEY